MAPIEVAIVIPAYNEDGSIYRVVSELNKVLKPILNDENKVIHNVAEQRSFAIVVVNDNSTDNTHKEAKKAGAYVVELKKNHGYSKAIEQGLFFACNTLQAKYLITMDADGQHDPKSVKKVLQILEKGIWDIVAGKREQCARISEKAFAAYFQHNFDISDPLSGLKGYKTSVFKEYGKFESFDSIGTELLTWAILKKYTVTQTDIHIRERLDKPRFGSTYSANKRIFKSLFKTIKFIKQCKTSSHNI